MVLAILDKNINALKIFYVCGEECPNQISLRIERMLKNSKTKNLREKLNQSLQFVTSSDVDEITALMASNKPNLVIVDSIQ
jgi:predicted ATP-dependent serine protease